MEERLPPVPIVLVDMAGFSALKTEDEQYAVLGRLRHALVSSIKPLVGHADPDKIIFRCSHGTGDGYYLFLENFSTPVAMRFGLNLEKFLKVDNASHAEYPLRLRVGLTLGQVTLAKDQILGKALTEAARLIDHDDIRELLKRRENLPLVLVASRFFWDDWQNHNSRNKRNLVYPKDRPWVRRELVVKHGETMVAFVQADAGDFFSQGKKPDDDTFKRDSEKLFNDLKGEIAQTLARSSSAMDALEAEMKGEKSEGASKERSVHLMERLIALDFDLGKKSLLAAREYLTKVSDTNGQRVVEKVARLLIPWLYVVSLNASDLVKLEWGEMSTLGHVLKLPAGIATLASIIMAGLDRREVCWKLKEKWPVAEQGGQLREVLQQPEGGIGDTTWNNVMQDLGERTKIPDEALDSMETQEESIRIELEQAFKEDGVRVFFLCGNPPKNDQDRKIYDNLRDRLQRAFPTLALIDLDQKWLTKDQKLFNEIRKLLPMEAP